MKQNNFSDSAAKGWLNHISLNLIYTIIQKFGVSPFFKDKLTILFSKEALNWSKVAVKTFIILLLLRFLF